jgi:hypothetical protein
MYTEEKQLLFSALALILQKLQTASVQADSDTVDMIKRLKEEGDASERTGWVVPAGSGNGS